MRIAATLIFCAAAGLVARAAIQEEGKPSSGVASQAPAASAEPFSQLAFMAGAWATEEGGVRREEHWIHPHGGTMLGLNRIATAEKTQFFEYLRIERRGDAVYYVASPLGRQSTDFKLVEVADRRAVFENPQHDFPQRIIYWLEGDVLHARIEREQGGKTRSMDFRWAAAK